MINEQKTVCAKFKAEYLDCPLNLKVGISISVRQGVLPVHGLRHKPDGDTTGWYIWAGEYSDAPDFFQPLHVSHIKDWCPWIEQYLGLAAGWRFLATPTYEDVWFDNALLEINDN
ncbi:MAG: immunity protein Imm33 domain-containing protein [Flavobacteriales bacterium]